MCKFNRFAAEVIRQMSFYVENVEQAPRVLSLSAGKDVETLRPVLQDDQSCSKPQIYEASGFICPKGLGTSCMCFNVTLQFNVNVTMLM